RRPHVEFEAAAIAQTQARKRHRERDRRGRERRRSIDEWIRAEACERVPSRAVPVLNLTISGEWRRRAVVRPSSDPPVHSAADAERANAQAAANANDARLVRHSDMNPPQLKKPT